MAIFAKEAYRSDVSVTTLLALRFTLAAGAFWAIVATRRAGPGPSRTPTRRIVLAGLALGGVGYAAQSSWRRVVEREHGDVPRRAAPIGPRV